MQDIQALYLREISVICNFHIAYFTYMENIRGRSNGCITCLRKRVKCGEFHVINSTIMRHPLIITQMKGSLPVSIVIKQPALVKATEACLSPLTDICKE